MSKQLFLEQNLKAGEDYLGIILGKDGAPDYHLILLPGQVVGIDWDTYVAWVKYVGEAPTKRELSLMFANAPEKFDKADYWSGEVHKSNYAYAWFQSFTYGYQGSYHKAIKLRGCAVRRLIIQ